MSLRTRVGGREFDVREFADATTSVSQVGSIEPRTYAVTAFGGGRFRVEHDGRQHVADVVTVGNARWVHVNGRAYRVEVADPTARVRGRAHMHEILEAPMPATVVRRDVQVGDEVVEGQVLIVLEAMKMQMPLKAPRRAVVRGIACALGDLVAPHVPLVELDDIDD